MQKRFIKASQNLAIATTIILGPATAFADPTTQPATQPTTSTAPSAVTWDQAAKHIGETLTVTGPVMGTHVTGDHKSLILNVGKDYPDPDRFTVMIQLDLANPASADTYEGKNISVTGKIEKYRKVPEIKATPAEVTIEK